MAFADVGKDITDQFTKDIAKDQTVELNASVNKYVSFALKGKVKSGAIEGTFAPIFKIPDYKIDIKPELTTPDDKKKTYKVEVVATDPFVKGLKFDFATTNGEKGESYINGTYKNSKFGGVTTKVTFPHETGKTTFISPSLYLETPDTRGFGVGGTGKIILGDNSSVESWKGLLSYKPDAHTTGFFGFESKPREEKKKDPKDSTNPLKESTNALKESKRNVKLDDDIEADDDKPTHNDEPKKNVFFVGGFLKKFDHSSKLVAVNGSYNLTTNSDAKLELLFRKNYEDGTFAKIRADLDGNAGVSKQFKPHGVNLILGSSLNIWNGVGNVGFHLATDL